MFNNIVQPMSSEKKEDGPSANPDNEAEITSGETKEPSSCHVRSCFKSRLNILFASNCSIILYMIDGVNFLWFCSVLVFCFRGLMLK